MRTLRTVCLLAFVLASTALRADPLIPDGPAMGSSIQLWPAARLVAGPAIVIPAEGRAEVGPVGFMWGVEAFLNLSHMFEVGISYRRLSLGGDHSIYNEVTSDSFLVINDLCIINRPAFRWGLLLGVGIGMIEIAQEKYKLDENGKPIPNKDINGDGTPDVPAPIGETIRKDTGPIVQLGMSLAWFPVDWLGLRMQAGADYRYTPNLTFKEGALLGLVLFGLEGHF